MYMNMKKIFGAMMLVAVAGVPFLAFSAGSCSPDTWRTTQLNCVQSGGTWTTSDGGQVDSGGTIFPTTGGSLGGASSNPTTGGSLGGTSAGLSANTQLQNPIKYSTFSQFAAEVTKTAVQVLMPFIVLAFIYSGFLFVSAQGNETKLTEAKNILMYSMIGAFILLGAWGFAQIIGQTVSTLIQ